MTAIVWSGWRMLLEINEGNNLDQVLRKYTWGLDLAGQNGNVNSLEAAGTIGGLLAIEEPPQVRDVLNYLYLYDGNGNVGQMVEWQPDLTEPPGAWAAQRLVAHYEYDPYGNITAQSGSYADSNPIRFSTKYLDAETGLSYFGYRYYAPGLGRWISRDLAEETAGENLYAYVANAPTQQIDPSGLWGSDMHFQKTFDEASNIGMKYECANEIAKGDVETDTITGAAFHPEYHFDFDGWGNRYPCGRSCWQTKRWNDAWAVLSSSSRTCGSDFYHALYVAGQSMHGLQDSTSHSVKHYAWTPVDHAPLLCLLPWFWSSPRCRPDVLAHNPNLFYWPFWQRPDKEKYWEDDYKMTWALTTRQVTRLWSLSRVKACCTKPSGGPSGSPPPKPPCSRRMALGTTGTDTSDWCYR